MVLTAGLQAAGLTAAASAVRTAVTHVGFGIAAGTEPVANNYSRVAVTWNAEVAGLVTNNGDLDSPIASGSWGTLTQVHGYNDPAAGDLVMVWDMSAGVAIASTQFLHIADTALTFQAA
jgi:hypothetical protein